MITGDQAKANVTTNESWVKDGQKVSFVTSSRVTLTLSTGNAVLLRAVSQVTMNEKLVIYQVLYYGVSHQKIRQMTICALSLRLGWFLFDIAYYTVD